VQEIKNTHSKLAIANKAAETHLPSSLSVRNLNSYNKAFVTVIVFSHSQTIVTMSRAGKNRDFLNKKI